MVKAEQTETLPTVDPKDLEAAYLECGDMFTEVNPDGSVTAKSIVNRLDRIQPAMQSSDALDLFRRLCLLVELVGDIDANWSDLGFAGERPQTLPDALFELASSEIAFESKIGELGSTFFMRDVLDEAISFFRPH